MTKRLFVSDFDGTITEKDFFLLYIDRFLGQRGRDYLSEYREQSNPDYQFLNNVFAMQKISREQYEELLTEIVWDQKFAEFLTILKKQEIDHLILSAGVAFYIEDALARKGLPKQRIIANSGAWKDGFICLTHDKESPIFSKQYGVDKGKAIKLLRREYDYIYFAGDSYPDIPAAEEADAVFAKKALWDHYQGKGIAKVHSFNHYGEILSHFQR